MQRTYVTPAEVIEQRDRPGFVSTARYGGALRMESREEIGAIVELTPGTDRWEHGMGVSNCKVLERIFILGESL